MLRQLPLFSVCVLIIMLIAGPGRPDISQAQAGDDWYVAPPPLGDNANDCATSATPCATITAAIGKASDGDTIHLAAGTYAESITLDRDLEISGAGQASTIIDASLLSTSAIIIQEAVTSTISGVSVTGGTGPEGGGIFVDRLSDLTLLSSTVTGNLAEVGGGIWVDGAASMSISASTISGNIATSHFAGGGGGIFNLGSLTIDSSTISGNIARADNGGGGGIVHGLGTLAISDSVFADNRATGLPSSGGAVLAIGDVNITDSTFLNNTSEQNGGAVYLAQPDWDYEITGSTFVGNLAVGGAAVYHGEGSLSIDNSTFSGNIASGTPGGTIYTSVGGTTAITRSTITGNSHLALHEDLASTITLQNSIVSGNADGCLGNVQSLGYNIVGENGDAGGCPSDGTGDLLLPGPVETLLDTTLADNGGPTMTHALLMGSPAVDGGDCTGTDQRGLPRGQDVPDYANAANACDIGAYEQQDWYTVNDWTVEEQLTTEILTITRGGDRSTPGGVSYATADGSAVAPDDYTAISETVANFPPGLMYYPVHVMIQEDDLDEGASEAFYVVLSGAFISGGPGTVTIVDDDTTWVGSNPPRILGITSDCASLSLSYLAQGGGTEPEAGYDFRVYRVQPGEPDVLVDSSNSPALAIGERYRVEIPFERVYPAGTAFVVNVATGAGEVVTPAIVCEP